MKARTLEGKALGFGVWVLERRVERAGVGVWGLTRREWSGDQAKTRPPTLNPKPPERSQECDVRLGCPTADERYLDLVSIITIIGAI